jgi:hypothetical protein
VATHFEVIRKSRDFITLKKRVRIGEISLRKCVGRAVFCSMEPVFHRAKVQSRHAPKRKIGFQGLGAGSDHDLDKKKKRKGN